MPRRPLRLVLFAALGAATMLAATVPTGHAPVAAREGTAFVSHVNASRAAANIGPVKLHAVVDRIAVERANQLAKAKVLGHDMEYVKKRLAQENVCWQRLGEIVASNSRPADERVAYFVDQWRRSDGHRAIMHGTDYTHAGGSYTTATNGNHYAAMIFIKLCGAEPSGSDSSAPFSDIAGSRFRSAITWLAERDIMDGCTATKFCPKAYLTRGQLASTLAAALDLPATSSDFYPDDDGSVHEDGINRLTAAGLTRGCGDDRYCPNQVVRRGHLATAIAWALGLPSHSKDWFYDDDGNRHESNINRIADASITSGCGDGRFCHNYRIRRAQAAA